MATETFFKTIYIDEAAADRLIAEMEKPREPYAPKRNAVEILKSEEEWWNAYLSKKSSKKAEKETLKPQ
ncbi:MAG: hypothetical protein FWD23_05900 [Oscillospiraceae bacterium]|nr:hypothetical protein [Oscillospiraceae bacterium]